MSHGGASSFEGLDLPALALMLPMNPPFGVRPVLDGVLGSEARAGLFLTCPFAVLFLPPGVDLGVCAESSSSTRSRNVRSFL